MTIPYNFDPLGSSNADPYKKGQVLFEAANPSVRIEQIIDVPKPGVYQVWLIGGGNPQCWCYIGCNGSGAAARGKSIWNGYGSGEVNGYGKLEYIRMRQ